MLFGLNSPSCFSKKKKKKSYFVIFIAEWLVHWTVVLEALGSIPTAGEKKFCDSTCFPYFHLQVSQVTKFDLGIKWVKVNPVLSSEQLQWAIVRNATFIFSRQLFWFQRKRFLKIIYHIWSWWPSWSCDWDQLNNISFLPTHKSFI